MLQDIVSANKVHFTAGAATEVRAQRSLKRVCGFSGGNLIANSRTDIKGVSARVYKNGLYGFASAGDLSDEAVKTVLQNASFNADFLNKHVSANRGSLPGLAKGSLPAQADFLDLPQKQYIDFLKELDQYILKTYPHLLSRTVVANCDSMEKLICTSDGHDGHIIAPRAYVYVVLTAADKEGQPVELFHPFGGSGSFASRFTTPDLLFAQVDALHEQLMQKCEGVYADAGLKTCILSGELAGMLAHEAVGHTVEADLVLAGSVSKHLLGKEVASPLVSLTDFAHTAFGETAPLPVYIDDEGVQAEDAILIENGILKGYMVNREMGERLQMKPCGNARAFSFSDEPLIRMRNTAVLPGKDRFEDMIASVEDGYYLISSGNGQADTTGEFMFGIVMGYEIKGGKLGRAIRDTTVSGVAFEMLKTVDMVGDTMAWSSSGMCGKKQPMPVSMGGPALKCRITIGGQ